MGQKGDWQVVREPELPGEAAKGEPAIDIRQPGQRGRQGAVRDAGRAGRRLAGAAGVSARGGCAAEQLAQADVQVAQRVEAQQPQQGVAVAAVPEEGPGAGAGQVAARCQWPGQAQGTLCGCTWSSAQVGRPQYTGSGHTQADGASAQCKASPRPTLHPDTHRLNAH